MANPNELAAPRDGQGDPNDQQSIVYLLKPNGSTNDTMDLQKLLAPIWRWRWVEVFVLLCTVLVAGWYYTKPGGETRYEIVVDRGNYSYLEVLDHFNRVLIPIAATTAGSEWSPGITMTDQRAERLAEIKKLSIEEEQQLALTPELFTISFTLSKGTEAQHTALAAVLTTRLQEYAAREAGVVLTTKDIAGQRLSQNLASQRRALTNKQRIIANAERAMEGAQRSLIDKETSFRLISETPYVVALRGAADKQLAMSQLAIDRHEQILSQLTAQEQSLGTRVEHLQSTLTVLTTSLDDADASTSGTAQLLADRIATGRLELEQRIPAMRLVIDRKTIEAQSSIERLQATLTQQELVLVNFGSNLAIRQANAQDAITVANEQIDVVQQGIDAAKQALEVANENIADAVMAITLFDKQTQAEVIHQPLTIVGQFTRTIAAKKKVMTTLAILIMGGMCSVGSAYGLEALRLARLGTLAN